MRFNLDEISDRSAPLPRTIPSAQEFGEKVGKVNNNDVILDKPK